MKNIYKYLSLLLIGLFFPNCSGDDKTVDIVLDQVTSGAVLRTRGITNNLSYNDVNKQFEEGSDYTLEIEEQDAEGGALLFEVQIFAGFVENTRVDTNGDGVINEDDDDLSIDEQLIRTLTTADFETGERGLPETVINFTAEELVSFTGIDESLIEGGDDFSLSFIISLTDGRTFSADDANGNVSGGSYFSSPYEYRTSVSCSITESLAGTYAYTITELTSAPGGTSNCPEAPLTGEVTWTETDTDGELETTDISFGQFGSCYAETFTEDSELEDILVVWDCTNLIAEGTITAEDADGDETEFTYTYSITEVSGADLTMEISSSAGDRATVIVTRPDGLDWPDLFVR